MTNTYYKEKSAMEDNSNIPSFDPEFIERMKKKREIRICEKPLLTVIEAAAYTGIGIKKLTALSNAPGCKFVLFMGNARMFIRQKLVDYLESNHSI